MRVMSHSSRSVALVTGGARRVGACVACALAEQGYAVAIHANASTQSAETIAGGIRDRGGEAIVLAADLSDDEQTEGLIKRVHGHFGQIDALVNSAAIWQPKPLEETTADDLRRHLEINTVAMWSCCKQVGLIMAGQQQGGAIVNLGDWATARPYADYSAYFPSKGAVEALTRSMAVELSQRNSYVRVNAILPGPVMLPPDMPAAERERAIAGTLVRREGSPDHIADAVLFLLRNDFVTGVCLPVDGGRTICPQDSSSWIAPRS
jgi:pteridine reductase